jgi:hypothetical protein
MVLEDADVTALVLDEVVELRERLAVREKRSQLLPCGRAIGGLAGEDEEFGAEFAAQGQVLGFLEGLDRFLT